MVAAHSLCETAIYGLKVRSGEQGRYLAVANQPRSDPIRSHVEFTRRWVYSRRGGMRIEYWVEKEEEKDIIKEGLKCEIPGAIR